MANYVNGVVTNTMFAVKDFAAFKAELEQSNCDFEIKQENGKVWIGGWDVSFYPWDENDEEVDVLAIIQKHLADGERAVLHEIGYEKLRYLTACVYVVTPQEYKGRDCLSWAQELLLEEMCGIPRRDRPHLP